MNASRVRAEDLHSLETFLEDYPMAEASLVYCGDRDYREGRIHVLALESCLRRLPDLI